MNRCLLLVFLVVSLTNTLPGQTDPDIILVGIVTDDQGYPLSEANVLLLSPRQTSKGAVTGPGGVFEIEMRPGDSLRISYVGYKTAWRSYEEMQKGSEVPLLKGEGLPGVVVSAYGSGPKIDITCSCTPIREYNPVINLALGIEKRAWNFYPNPASDHLTIESKELTGRIRVFSLTGVELTRILVNDELLQINLRSMPPGTYVLRYEREGWRELIGKVEKIK
jgi:hypothetical protein